MRSSQQFRMTMTRRGDKEARLGAFVSAALRSFADSRQGGGLHVAESEDRPILVMARSAKSPVVKSIAALARDIAAAGCSVRLILARGERAGLSEVFIAVQTAGVDCEVRVAGNPRLIEAHEQLVLGARTCWTGDTMRRDPATCDAYEWFVEDTPELAAAARLTFERLWADGEPFTGLAPVAAALRTPKTIAVSGLLVRRP